MFEWVLCESHIHPHFEFLKPMSLLTSVVLKSKGHQFRENSAGEAKKDKKDKKELLPCCQCWGCEPSYLAISTWLLKFGCFSVASRYSFAVHFFGYIWFHVVCAVHSRVSLIFGHMGVYEHSNNHQHHGKTEKQAPLLVFSEEWLGEAGEADFQGRAFYGPLWNPIPYAYPWNISQYIPFYSPWYDISYKISSIVGEPIVGAGGAQFDFQKSSHLQPLVQAATCSHLLPSGCLSKWLQVAAKGLPSGCLSKWLPEQVAAKWLPSGCKWLQVAAFSKIKMMHVCSLSGWTTILVG